MPSAFAHAVVGASLASLAPPDAPRARAAWVLAAVAAAPDLDVVSFRLGIDYADPLGHRGLTHSLFFALAVGLASLPLWRMGPALRPYARWLAGVTCIACASHGLLDTLTDDGLGIGLLLPFDDGRYFAPWRPLLTSPLSPERFFTSGRGAAILANEALWVGLPALLLAALARVLRRRS